jgi:hypothetical protein
MVDPDPAAAWRPQIEDVAALLRARTKDDKGEEHGTFDDTTRPNATQVDILITNGCADVATWVGYDFHESLIPEARNLASIYAACQVEESYFPEQVASQRSVWDQLWRRYQYGLQRLVETAGSLAEAGTIGATQGTLLTPGHTVAAQAWLYGGGYMVPPWGPPLPDVEVNPLGDG